MKGLAWIKICESRWRTPQKSLRAERHCSKSTRSSNCDSENRRRLRKQGCEWAKCPGMNQPTTTFMTQRTRKKQRIAWLHHLDSQMRSRLGFLKFHSQALHPHPHQQLLGSTMPPPAIHRRLSTRRRFASLTWMLHSMAAKGISPSRCLTSGVSPPSMSFIPSSSHGGLSDAPLG